MPRVTLSDSLAVLKIVEHEDEDNWDLETDAKCKQKKKSQDSYFTKTNCTCYYNYGLGETSHATCQMEYDYKACCLPSAAASTTTWDNMIYPAISLLPEDIANQLTLLDLLCFKAIRPEELITCGWNKLNKLTVAPNVVAFTKRFNRVSFWTVQEVLNGNTPKTRAETIAHFVKVGKRLFELNNLHSLFAIICALQSASIYRLSKTWANLSKKDKAQFDKLVELFSDRDNWSALREYMRSISLPCIPYLGIFLTDLVYIDIAHPVGSSHRLTKMAVVLQALERYQGSEYDIAPFPQIGHYLNSVRYIEELQKFLEDDQYKLSLKLEPPSPVDSCCGSKESLKDVSAPSCSVALPHSPSHRIGSGSLRLYGTYGHTKFIPTHRKSRSLGSKFRSASLPRNFHKGIFFVGIFGKGHCDDKRDGKTPAGSVNLLDDTLLESPGDLVIDKHSVSLPHTGMYEYVTHHCDYEGFLKRKKILKNGRRPSLSSWQRFWIRLSRSVLIFHAPKSFKGMNRGDFRTEHCKVIDLERCTASVMAMDAPETFQLVNHRTSTVYKFKAQNGLLAKQWVSRLCEVTNSTSTIQPLPANLMSFE